MDKFIKFFQKNGIIKILSAFALMFLICWLFNVTQWNFLKGLLWIPGTYLIVAWITFVIDLITRIYWEQYHKKHDTLK